MSRWARASAERTIAGCFLVAVMAATPAAARAQDHVDALSRPRDAEGPPPPGWQPRPPPPPQHTLRLAFQGRLDALNLLGHVSSGTTLAPASTVAELRPALAPIAVGLRFGADRAFVGAAVGLTYGSSVACTTAGCGRSEATYSSNAFMLGVLSTIDIIHTREAALHALVGLHFLSGTASIESATGVAETSLTGFGFHLGLGLRAFLTRGLALGTEWGFAYRQVTTDVDSGVQAYNHGLFGSLLLEASLGL